LKQVASRFEGVFLKILMKQMLPRNGGGFFGSGPSSDLIQGLFVDQFGEALSGQRPLGIADVLERSFERNSRSQENRVDTRA